MITTNLETPNLRLVPYAPEHLRALFQAKDFYTRRFGLLPAKGLQDFFASKEVADAVSPEYLARIEVATEPDPWTLGFAVLHLASDTVIGSAGFKGPPGAEGMVEIAYGIVPDYQGQGYATEAAQALVAYAFGNDQVRVVWAHTLPERNASARVLTKCGFRCLGEVVDPEDGLVWRWEKLKQESA